MTITVRFLPEDRLVEVEQGTTILEAARAAGVVIESPCNGAGTCGKCAVKLVGALPEAVRVAASSTRSGDDGGVDTYPACHTEAHADLIVRLPEREKLGAIDVLKEGEGLPVALDPFMRKEFDDASGLTRIFAGETEVAGWKKAIRVTAILGLAVDIGTTTLVASLVDLEEGVEIGSASSLNPQASTPRTSFPE